MKEFGDGFDGVTFPRLFISWRKLRLSPLEDYPCWIPIVTISKNSLSTLLCSLILDHGACLTISASGAKILISNFLLDTSLHHRFQSVLVRSFFLRMNLQVTQFQYGLEFPRLSCSQFVQPFQDVTRWDFRQRQWNSVPLWVEFLNIVISKTKSEQVGIVLDRIIGSQWPGIVRRSSRQSVYLEGNGPASGPFIPPDWFFFWSENHGWFFSVLKQSSHEVLQNLEFWISYWWRRL